MRRALSASSALLLACASGDLQSPLAATTDALNWNDVIWAADVHGLTSILHARLVPEHIDVPAWARQALERQSGENLARSIALTEDFEGVRRRLADAGIAAVAIEGPAVDRALYPRAGLREAALPVFLVHREDLERGLALVGDSNAIVTDEIAPPDFRVPSDQECILNRGEAAPDDVLLVLCVEGARRRWTRLGTLCDVAQILRRDRAIDLPRLAARARREGTWRILALGLTLARDWVDAPLPAEIARAIDDDAAVRRVASRLTNRALTESPRPPSIAERVRVHAPLLYRARDRWTYWRALAELRRRRRRRPAPPPWVPTPPDVARRMFELAAIGASDVVLDPGCGDGRLVIEVARRFGVSAVGIDMDPDRIAESRRQAADARVGNLVRFDHADAFDADVSAATVVLMFMSRDWNDAMVPKFRRQLAPGSRIVSWNNDFAGWPPDALEIMSVGGEPTRIYLWKIGS